MPGKKPKSKGMLDAGGEGRAELDVRSPATYFGSRRAALRRLEHCAQAALIVERRQAIEGLGHVGL